LLPLHELREHERVLVAWVNMKKARKKAANAGDSVMRRKQLRILEAFGKFEFDPAYDYKAERNRAKRKQSGA
jgi:hypothetical protein